MKKSLITLAIIASLATLTGCGSSDSSDPVVKESSTLAGTAAKGIITQGIVSATELAADGSEIGVVGTAVTDNSGHYNLKLTDAYQGGVVKLTISADENTKMKCDATSGCGTGNGFGSSISLSDGFSLNAIVKPEGESVNVQITPLTTMATVRALVAAQSGQLNAESVANAISEVNQITGVNIMNTEVVDITDAAALAGASEDAKQLAVFNSGLADVLVAGQGSIQQNLVANLSELSSSFEDGEFSSDDDITITQITDAITTAVASMGQNTEIATLLEDSIAKVETSVEVIKSQVGEDGGFNPEPSENVGSDKITQAKSLITQARTFIEKIESDFSDPLDALSIDAETVSAALDSDSIVMTELLGVAIDQTVTDLSEKNIDIFALLESSTPTEYQTTITDELGEPIGTMTSTFSSTADGVSITLNGSLTGEAETVNVTGVTLATNLAAEDLTTSTDSETQDTLIDAITASSVQIKLTGFVGNESASVTLTDLALTLSASEAVTLDMTDTGDNSALESKISGASFIGDVTIASGDASFSGDVEIVLVGFANSVSEVPLSLQKIEVNGEFTSTEKGSFSAGAKLTIDNAASFDTFGYLDHQPSAYEHVYLDTDLSAADKLLINAAVENAEFESYYLDSTTTPYYGFSKENGTYSNLYYFGVYEESGESGWFSRADISGSFNSLPDLEALVLATAREEHSTTPESETIVQLMYDNSKYQEGVWTTPGWVYADVQFTFADFETANNFVQGTLMVMAKANVPELPEATIVASVSRTELSGGDASIVVTYDGKSFSLTVDSEDLNADEPEATLVLTNPDGVELTINLAETLSGNQYVVGGKVSVAGEQVATIEETDSGLVLVRYSDGSFESLF